MVNHQWRMPYNNLSILVCDVSFRFSDTVTYLLTEFLLILLAGPLLCLSLFFIFSHQLMGSPFMWHEEN